MILQNDKKTGAAFHVLRIPNRYLAWLLAHRKSPSLESESPWNWNPTEPFIRLNQRSASHATYEAAKSGGAFG